MPQTRVPPVWGSAAGASVAGALSVDGASLPAGALLSTLGASVPAVPAVVPLSESPPPHAAGDQAERGQRRDDDERAAPRPMSHVLFPLK